MASNQVKKKKQEFTWKIENFSNYSLKRGQKLLSPTFVAENLGKTAWYLELYPKGYDISDDGNVSCFLTRKEDDAVQFAIECDFVIEIIDKYDLFVEFLKGKQTFERGSSLGLINIMKLDELVKTALSDDTIAILCTLSGNIAEKSTYSQISDSVQYQVSKHKFNWDMKDFDFNTQQKVFKIPSSVSSYSEIVIHVNNATAHEVDTIDDLKGDLKRMYLDKIHSDIKLKAGKEVFPAHKSILCSRSPVFMAMFDNDMAESQSGQVDIPDLEAKTVGLFLEYIYTGTVNDLDYENAIKLIVAADKYEVLTLKKKCADLLAAMLSDVNVCDILVTADMVQHDILKASAINYIERQPKKIFKSEEWKHCVKNNVLLATETAAEVAMLLGDLASEQSGSRT